MLVSKEGICQINFLHKYHTYSIGKTHTNFLFIWISYICDTAKSFKTQHLKSNSSQPLIRIFDRGIDIEMVEFLLIKSWENIKDIYNCAVVFLSSELVRFSVAFMAVQFGLHNESLNLFGTHIVQKSWARIRSELANLMFAHH